MKKEVNVLGKGKGIESKIQPDRCKHLNLAPCEVKMVEACMVNGQISFEVKYVKRFDQKTWQVTKEIVISLTNEYRMTRKAELFITSDSKENLRYMVRVGTWNKAFNFISNKA